MIRKKKSHAEYIWLDGANPTQGLRAKTRVLFQREDNWTLDSFPQWSFDGSSTNQASQQDSDCLIKPVFFTKDPLREGENFLVLCEVLHPDSSPHPSNQRAKLRKIMQEAKSMKPFIGFEQEYTLLEGPGNKKWPLGWPKDGFPEPQGPFYCGVGADKAYGREIAEEHAIACEIADLNLYGVNAEVMPAQWEFQIGYRGEKEEAADPLSMSDHLWIARYLLKRIAEKYSVTVSFNNKPIKGDWNGAGMHTNFSTSETRNKKDGMEKIKQYISCLEQRHAEHIKDYGHGLEKRLTGRHETCHISEFKYGVANRGASIRIPLSSYKNGYGYLEDRRPGANANPYIISIRLLESTCL